MEFTELTEFFRGYIENEYSPVVICNLDYKIIYMNPFAARLYKEHGGAEIVGKPLFVFMNEEARSKVDMVIEWFREDKSNNRVFAFHDDEKNADVYVVAIRNAEGTLIGFSSRHEYRNHDTGRQYAVD